MYFDNAKVPLGRWHNARVYVLVIRRLIVHTISVLLVLTVHTISACHRLAAASAANWSIKGYTMCYHVYVIMHIKDPTYFI